MLGGAVLGKVFSWGIGKLAGRMAAQGLGNPFKNMSLDEIKTVFDRYVKTGKLRVVHKDPVTGLNKTYVNTKSGYSYNLDPGRAIRQGETKRYRRSAY